MNKKNEKDMGSSALVNILAVGAQQEQIACETCTNQE